MEEGATDAMLHAIAAKREASSAAGDEYRAIYHRALKEVVLRLMGTRRQTVSPKGGSHYPLLFAVSHIRGDSSNSKHFKGASTNA